MPARSAGNELKTNKAKELLAACGAATSASASMEHCRHLTSFSFSCNSPRFFAWKPWRFLFSSLPFLGPFDLCQLETALDGVWGASHMVQLSEWQILGPTHSWFGRIFSYLSIFFCFVCLFDKLIVHSSAKSKVGFAGKSGVRLCL